MNSLNLLIKKIPSPPPPPTNWLLLCNKWNTLIWAFQNGISDHETKHVGILSSAKLVRNITGQKSFDIPTLKHNHRYEDVIIVKLTTG